MKSLKLLLCLLLYSMIAFTTAMAQPSVSEIHISNSSLQFIPNQNQFNEKVEYLCMLSAMDRVYLEKDGFTYVFHEHENFHECHAEHECENEENKEVLAHAYKVHFEGANSVSPSGYEKKKHHLNYFLGSDESKWASNVPVYQTAEYKNLYDGIDLKSYSQNGFYKYDFIIEPGANPNQINLRYEGVDDLKIKNNELLIPAAGKIIKESKPYAYQIIDDKKVEVACDYNLSGNSLSFQFPNSFDRSKALIIDPIVIGATLTGSPTDGGFGHTGAFDNEGNMYLGGISFGPDYPVTLGAFQTSFAGGNEDIAVSKYNPSGTELIYASYLGSSGNDWPHSIIVDKNQQLCVLGTSEESDYPTTSSAYSTQKSGGIDIVVSRLNKDGSQLIGSTYIGGAGSDGQNLSGLNTNYGEEYRGEINLDSRGNIYIASCSSSPDFPTTTGAYQRELNQSGSDQDGVIFKLNSDLSVLFWSTFLGGTDRDMIASLRIDDIGEIYVTGVAGHSDFPTTGGLIQSDWPGGEESAFISVLSANGQNLLRSTFWGTDGIDHAYFLDLDEENNVHIYGQTNGEMLITPNTYFFNENSRQYISALTKDLTEVVYSTTIGRGPQFNDNYDFVPVAFMVDKCNGIYFSGYYAKSNLPLTPDAIYTNSVGDGVFYLGVLSPKAESLTFGTYYGEASHVDGGTSRFDKGGIVYQAVCSCQWSGELNTTPGAYTETQTAGCNAGIFKIDLEIATVTADVFVEPEGSGCAPFEVDFTFAGRDGVTYFWDFGGLGTSTQKNPSFTFTDPGNYEVVLIAENLESCNVRDTAIVFIDVLGGQGKMQTMKLCENTESTFLDASLNEATYEWNNGATGPTIEVFEAGTYWVDISLPNCTTRDSFVVEVQTSSFDLGPDVGTCVEGSFQLDAADSNVQSYQWSNGMTTSTIEIEESGKYTITVTDNDACYFIDTIEILLNQAFEINFGPDTVICSGETLLLEANFGDIDYEWQDGSGNSSFEVTEPGNYTLLAESDYCDDAAEINVNFSELSLELGDDQAFCGEVEYLIEEENITTNSQLFSYEWNEGSTTENLTVTESGEYSLVITDINGCTTSDQIEILLEPYPDPALPDLKLCANDSLVINLVGIGSDYTWQDGSTNASIAVNQVGQYSVHIVEQHCEFNDTFEVLFYEEPSISFVVDSLSCFGECVGTIQTTASANVMEYDWSNGSSLPNQENLCSDQYLLNFTDVNGCIFTEEVLINEPEELLVSYILASYDCNGETIGVWELENLSGGTTPYEYQIDGLVENDGIAQQLTSGVHNIFVTDSNGCTIDEEFSIQNAPPNFINAGEDQIIEVGTSTFLNGSVTDDTDLMFSWSPNETIACDDCLTSTTRPLDSIEYVLSATNIVTGCVMSDTVFIEVREKEAVFIPNIFTPSSNDGNNHFTVFSKSARLDVLKLRIFDRWGSLIYESENFDTNDPIQGWDGTFQGEKVMPGVYVYMAEVLYWNGEEKIFTGDITVID